MDSNFAELLTTAGWNTPTHILEGRLILSVVKVLFTGCTPSLHPHCTHKGENAKGKGCTCTRCIRGSGIPDDGSCAHIEKLHKLHKRAARVITGSNYEIRSTEIFEKLGWEKIETILK